VRQWQLTLNTNGTVSFWVHGTAGTVVVTSPLPLLLGQWYHLVGTVEAGNVKLYVNNVVVAAHAWADSVITGFTATAGSADVLVGDNFVTPTTSYDEFAFYRYGLSEDRVSAHYDAGVNRGFVQQSSATRIAAILDASSSHTPRQSVSPAGTETVLPEYMRGQAPLDSIRSAVLASVAGQSTGEAGFFTAADGTLTFLAAGHRTVSPYNTVQVTFGDQGGSELSYLDFNLDYSDSFLANEWNVTRAGNGAVTQTTSDAASISRYGKRPQSLTGLPVTTDSVAELTSVAMLAKYKDPMERITQLSFNTLDSNVALQLFRRDLMDKIRVLRTPPGGGARIQQDLYIQKIDVSGDNSGAPWSITWGVSPL
jgi:hypothetical protein